MVIQRSTLPVRSMVCQALLALVALTGCYVHGDDLDYPTPDINPSAGCLLGQIHRRGGASGRGALARVTTDHWF